MILKMIDEVDNNDLPIDERIDLLEDLKMKMNEEIQRRINKIKDNAIYCPFCARYYEKDICDVYDESIERKEACVEYGKYEEKGFKVKYFACPKGHKLRRLRRIDEDDQTDGLVKSDVWFK